MKRRNRKITRLDQRTKKRKNNPDYVATGLMVYLTEEISMVMTTRKWTRSKLAKKMKCSEAYITKLLRGEENLTIRKIAQIAVVLGLQPKVVLDGETHDAHIAQKAFTKREMKGDILPWDATLSGSVSTPEKATVPVSNVISWPHRQIEITTGEVRAHG